MIQKLILLIITCLSLPGVVNADPPYDAKTASENLAKHTKYKGWDHLATKLLDNGVSKEEIEKIYKDKRMPKYSKIPFALKAKESADIYKVFLKKNQVDLGRSFLKKHHKDFNFTEKKYPVTRQIITSIILVETQAGRYTGDSVVIDRISRLAGIADINNLVLNYHQHKSIDKSVTFTEVQQRGQTLEQMFLDEVPALIKIAKINQLDIFNIKGSRAGAFGLPQFMPTSYLNFAVDGNGDGKVSLFEPEDAICSVANYLSKHDWKHGLSKKQKAEVIWKYNRSKPYVDTVLELEEIFSKS
ncbi:MAG: lytic murein transglycosylase [Bdellovibrionota bacterium]